MAHATPLTLDLSKKKTRPAAAGGRAILAANDTQLQLRLPAQDVRAIKRDALEMDQSISAFLLACYHATKRGSLKLKK